ncbi:quinone-dependent dihydroorotate dehydrogenase [Nakamurella endophytica]|uniref:Dihydroorotate dehydrogenase (quinone) n=1 Tax=Nakamurella endophytica TaxID=1748367 RepID=A0A917W9V5_9ACTN|nr:quinone-dependent dihydroorotate dehydrogenase [Nakamurella endophytica]GGL86196.1 dihydroorotate dehydrogenase (quinone) [Nakamurella endophytica]
MTVLDQAYRRVARPVLFRAGGGDAEAAHHRTLRMLTGVGRVAPLRRAVAALLAREQGPRTVFGVRFPAVLGLAAGMDKDGVAARAWPALGFGHVEFGTVTAQPQPGNERPRLFRLVRSEAIVNRMGFNNAGAQALAGTLAAAGPLGIPVGVSLGKSRTTPVDRAVGDYLASMRAVHGVADYVAVNVSSPNTPGLRELQDRHRLDELLGALTEQAHLLARDDGRGRPVPVLVKIAPDLTEAAIGEVLQVCADRGVAGVIATNTTTGRDGVDPADRATAEQPGGLSGRPLRDRSLAVVRFVAAHTDLPVIGVGGIGSAADGLAMLDAGAALLQLYTGLVYRGPGLVAQVNRAAAARSPREEVAA